MSVSSRIASSSLMGVVTFLASCSSIQPASHFEPPPSPPSSWPAIAVSAAGEEEAKLEGVVATLRALFASPGLWEDFADVAEQYPQIYVGPEFQQTGQTAGMTDAAGAAALLRNSEGHFRAFESVVTLTGTYYPKGQEYEGICVDAAGDRIECRGTKFRQNYSNELVATHGIGFYLPSGNELVSIEIGRTIFDRYNSPSLDRKSCTFNTLAHEWTHTLGKDQNNHWAIVVDDARPSAGVPIISYLFGSVVQCHWLKSQNVIGSGIGDLRACVNRFGTSEFNSLQCV